MKKRNLIANIVMAAVILALIAASLLLVGRNRGWFGRTETPCATAVEWAGTVELERDGIAYPIETETALRDGDLLETRSDARLTIRSGESVLTLNEQTTVEIESASIDGFTIKVTAGEVFASAAETPPLGLRFAGRETSLCGAVISLSVRTGSESLCVYAGEVSFAGDAPVSASAGQILRWSGSDASTAELEAASLDAFCLAQATALSESRSLCFTAGDLRQVALDREAERQAAIEEQTQLNAEEEQPEEPEEVTPPAQKPEQPEDGPSVPGDSTEPEPTAPDSPPSPADPQPEPDPEPDPPASTCTISIRCDTILNNMGSLTPGKEAYVPGNGVILSTTTVEFTEGETVFDILQRACSAAGIQLESSYTPAYGSHYVEGIHQLYEMDCGPESGWMYQVNGWFPNYGCSSYTVSQGDAIVWCYTCVGLGADVGASVG